MAENQRKRIYSDLIPNGDIENDIKIIPAILRQAINIHKENVTRMDKLIEYYYNQTPIKNKEKSIRKDINNKTTVPYPSLAVSIINGYTFSIPFKYIISKDKFGDEVKKSFSQNLKADGYYEKTISTELWAGKTGVGYKYIRPATEEEIKNGIYFSTVGDLDPRNVFCVYSSKIDSQKILGVQVSIENIYDDDYNIINKATVYNVWTKYHYYEFTDANGVIEPRQIRIKDGYVIAYKTGYGIPLIEYPRKQERIADFEFAMDLIDANEALISARVDAVAQNSDFLLLLQDIDTESEGALDRVKACLKEGILSFKTLPSNGQYNSQPSVNIMQIPLNQSEIQQLQDFICLKIEEACQIPNRETRAAGGDTGDAVSKRNGYTSLQNISQLITSSALQSETEAMNIILNICKNFDCPFNGLEAQDIDIHAMKNSQEDLSTLATSFSTLYSATGNAEFSLTATGIMADVPHWKSVLENSENNVQTEPTDENDIKNNT